MALEVAVIQIGPGYFGYVPRLLDDQLCRLHNQSFPDRRRVGAVREMKSLRWHTLLGWLSSLGWRFLSERQSSNKDDSVTTVYFTRPAATRAGIEHEKE